MRIFLLVSIISCLSLGISHVAQAESTAQNSNSSNTSVEAIQVYKLQLGSQGNDFSIVPFINTSRNEWVRITVSGRKVKLLHSTSVSNPVGIRNWYDHPVTMIRMCVADSFESKNCQIVKGDTVELPADKTIYDVAIDFKFVESGSVATRSFQISTDLKPEKL